jgi:hypothetical protein
MIATAKRDQRQSIGKLPREVHSAEPDPPAPPEGAA